MSEKETGDNILSFIIIVYFLASQVMAVRFWIEWFADHTLINSIFLGTLVAEFKGLLWVLFIW